MNSKFQRQMLYLRKKKVKLEPIEFLTIDVPEEFMDQLWKN